MLQLAQGRPIRPYRLANKVLSQNPFPNGDKFGHQRRLADKLKKLLKLVDKVLTEDNLPNTEEDRQREAMTFLRYLMEPEDPKRVWRAEMQQAARAEWEETLRQFNSVLMFGGKPPSH
jgi:hypothetical protein